MDMAWVSCAAHSVQGKMVKLAIDGAEKKLRVLSCLQRARDRDTRQPRLQQQLPASSQFNTLTRAIRASLGEMSNPRFTHNVGVCLYRRGLQYY